MRTKAAAAEHAAKMESMVMRWRSSGLSQAAFSKREGIKPHILTYWHRRVGAEAAKEPTNFVEFVPAKAADQESSVPVYEVALPGGFVIRVRSGFDVTCVCALAQALAVS